MEFHAFHTLLLSVTMSNKMKTKSKKPKLELADYHCNIATVVTLTKAQQKAIALVRKIIDKHRAVEEETIEELLVFMKLNLNDTAAAIVWDYIYNDSKISIKLK